MRCSAKTCLNGFGGKFGQRLSMKQSMFFYESGCDQSFFRFFQIPSMWIKLSFHVYVSGLQNKHIFFARFTTAHARLRLYSVLDRFGEDVLYFDTDSVIFKTQKSIDLHYLPIGNYLREFTNEIKPEDCYIVEFVSEEGGGQKLRIPHSFW